MATHHHPDDEQGRRVDAPDDSILATGHAKSDDREAELLIFDAGKAAAEILNRSADSQIIEMLRAAGRDSRLVSAYEKELRDFGVGTLIVLNSKRRLFKRLVTIHIYLPKLPNDYFKDARTLIHLSVCAASGPFIEKYVLGDHWDPNRGASLHTCFVNACLCQFAVEYRRYCNEERRDGVLEPDFEEELNERQRCAPRPPPDPQVQAVDRIEIERLLAVDMSPKDKVMFIRTAQGFSQKEIADELGLSDSAVSSRMRRNRKRIADFNRETGGICD